MPAYVVTWELNREKGQNDGWLSKAVWDWISSKT
jgi:hypothetical protein